jgi:gamma-glutamyl-gamma-aminobutyrate hydrolase PuuD
VALGQVFRDLGPAIARFLPARDVLIAGRISRNVNLAASPEQIRAAVGLIQARRSMEAFRATLAANNAVSKLQAQRMGVVIVRGDNFVSGNQSARSARGRAATGSDVSRIIEQRRTIPPSPVTIVHREDGHGTGAFWDHYTTQKMTGRNTLAVHPDAVTPSIVTHAANGNRGHNYRGAMPSSDPLPLPSEVGGGSGLLMIAGGNAGLESEQSRRHKDHTPTGDAAVRHGHRQALERELLRQARLTGRPVLAVCGGSWRLLETFGGQTRLVDPNTHQSRQMPYLRADGQVGGGSHIQEHGVRFATSTSILSGAMQTGGQPLPANVNSVHWAVADERRPRELTGVERLAPSSSTEPGRQMLQVTARGATEQERPYQGLSSTELQQRHRNAVEAFETRHGAPMLGLQWHPEAYNPDQPEYHANRNVMNFMARAGDAYEARRLTLRQFRFVSGLLEASGLAFTATNIKKMSLALAKLEGRQ